MSQFQVIITVPHQTIINANSMVEAEIHALAIKDSFDEIIPVDERFEDFEATLVAVLPVPPGQHELEDNWPEPPMAA